MLLVGREPIFPRKVHVAKWLWIALAGNLLLATLLQPASRLTAPSATDLPLSIYRLLGWVIAFLLLLLVYTRAREEEATEVFVSLIARVCWITVGMVWLLLPIIPSQVYGYSDEGAGGYARLGGQFAVPANLATCAAVCFFHALLYLRGPRKWAACSIAVVTLAMTYARAEQILFLLALLAYMAFLSRKPALQWTSAISVLFLGGKQFSSRTGFSRTSHEGKVQM